MFSVQFFMAGVQKDITPCIAAMFACCFIVNDDSWGFPV